MRRRFLYSIICLLLTGFVYGKCPDNVLLWKRLLFLSESSSVAATPGELQKQLKELLAYVEDFENCSSRNDSTHAFLLQRVGSIYYKLGDIFKAIQVTRQSVSMINAGTSQPYINKKNLVKDYYNLSVYFGAINKVPEKMEAIDSCATIAIRLDYVDPIALFALVEHAHYLFEIGDYERCILYATMGENITALHINGPDSINYVSNFFVLRVNALIYYKDYEQAESLLSRKISEYKEAGAFQHLGTIYELLAEVLLSHGDKKKSLFYFQQAIKYDEAKGFNQGCMQTLNNLGYIYYFKNSHDVKKALSTFKRALSYADRNGEADESVRLEVLNILGNMAKMYGVQGLYDSSFRYFQLAFDQLSPGINENNFINNFESFVLNKETIYLVTLVIEKGDTYFEKFKNLKDPALVSEAVRIYKVADRLLYRIKSGHSEIQSMLFWRNNSRRLYEHAIEACYQQNNMEDAFYFMEKSRAVLLNDQIDEQRLMGEDNVLKIAQLKRKILLLETELRASRLSIKQKAEIENNIFTEKKALDRLIAKIKSHNPLYSHNQRDTAFISIQQLRKELSSTGQVITELFAGDSAVYSMFISAKQIRFYKIDKTEFDSTSSRYISFVSNVELLNSRFEEFLKTSRKLYELIFPQGAIPAGRIIISPDGRYFPFECLVTSKAGSSLSYFLQEHAISYTYSARYLLHNTPATRIFPRSFLGVAPVRYPDNLNLTELSQSDLSLNNLKEYFPSGNVLISSTASKNKFLEDFYKYKIIQLYTHASDSGKAGEPVIYFADSALNLSELIPGNNPVTDLIVLSACETAKGKVHMGEGVFSFSRGFAAMGIPASITNLWAVENQSTYRLTELFYKYFATGIPSDVALQKAKLEFLQNASKEKELPFFWAAPILVGKAKKMEIENTYPFGKIAIVSLVAICCFFVIRKMMKIKR